LTSEPGSAQASNKKLTHLLFVDDVLIFCFCAAVEGKILKDIPSLFCDAMGMLININKSTIFLPNVEEEFRNIFSNRFNFPLQALGEGIKYLGFMSKPNNYGIANQSWLLSKKERKNNHRCNWWISIGGRLVLIKSLIEEVPVYWHLLALIPKGILCRIRKLCFNFL
jgi:hypothetical protein